MAKTILEPLHKAISNFGSFVKRRKSEDQPIVGETIDNQSHTSTQEGESSFCAKSEEPSTTSSPDDKLDTSLEETARPKTGTWIVFLPRDPQWAYVFWEILDHDRESAQVAGAGQLCIRLADVTGLSGGNCHPHTMQEMTVNSNAKDWYLPVPLSDRFYRVELGYRKIGGGWISLANSAVALVPGLHPSRQIFDQFVPFSLDGGMRQLLVNPPLEADNKTMTNLHEILYQKATLPSSRWRQLGEGSEALHEVGLSTSTALAAGQQSSGLGGWVKGFNESGTAAITLQQQNFWLVADAELIVYGATDPSANLTIGDEHVTLASDGTFRVQVPFRDGQQIYPIRAESADAEEKRSITLKFERHTPVDNSMLPSEVAPKWF